MSTVIDITPADVQAWLDTGEAIVIDVREDQEVAQARIPTEAIHLPLSRFDPDQVPKDGAKKLVFVCAQGVRSYQAGQYLLSQGLISEAYNMDGGIAAWHYAGLPLDRD